MADDENDVTMSDLFDRVLKDLDYFENIVKPLSDPAVQDQLKSTVKNCEKLVTMSNQLSIFSDNEDVEDISTKDLKYLLLPALLAYFKNKEIGDRMDVVKTCQTYYRHFLQLCRLYGLTTYVVSKEPNTTSSSSSSIDDLSREREEKVKRFKRRRQLESELAELNAAASGKNADDSVVREYYLKLIDKWIADGVDNLMNIDQELQILEHMEGLAVDKNKTAVVKTANNGAGKKFQPFILTRDVIQKKVFGLGYPSVPIFTVDEFYDQRVAAGLFPSPGNPQKIPNKDPGAEGDDASRIKKEIAVENDDPEERQRLRDWDEYKDEHRRGWGNTHNKG